MLLGECEIMFLKDSSQKNYYEIQLEIQHYEIVLQQVDRDLSQTDTTDWIRDTKSGELAKHHEASFSAFFQLSKSLKSSIAYVKDKYRPEQEAIFDTTLKFHEEMRQRWLKIQPQLSIVEKKQPQLKQMGSIVNYFFE